MKHRILQVGRLLPELEASLAADFNLHRLADEPDPEAFLQSCGAGFVGLVTSAGGVGAPAWLLSALPSLRVISSFGVGLDKIDLALARERGIAVGHTPDLLNDCVADTAFSLMLDVGRRVSEADRFVRSGRWATEGNQGFGLGRKISGAKLGIVGLGRIGQTIARRAAGFDMPVRYHSRRAVEGVPWQHEAELPALARWADFLLISTSGGPATQHLVNAAVLEALGPEGYLVNVSRGSVVDEQALLQALLARRIAGAGLDVFEHEPQVPLELRQLDNVVLLPHMASATHQTRAAMAQRVLDNLGGFLDRGQLVSSAF